MKKLMGILTILFIAVGLSACGGSSKVAKVQPSDIAKKVEAKETFITIVSSSTCAACKEFAPVVEEFAKNNDKLTIVDVETDKISDTEQKTKFVNTYSISSTPTILFFKDGKIVGSKEGSLTDVELAELRDQYLK